MKKGTLHIIALLDLKGGSNSSDADKEQRTENEPCFKTVYSRLMDCSVLPRPLLYIYTQNNRGLNERGEGWMIKESFVVLIAAYTYISSAKIAPQPLNPPLPMMQS